MATTVHQFAPSNSNIVRMARFGYAAKGVTYCLIGVLAAMVAFGQGGQTSGRSQSFQWLEEMPGGKALLVIVGLGLLCFAAWRTVQAIWDTENHGEDSKATIKRVGYGISALIYGFLAFRAVQVALTATNSGGNQRQLVVDRLLDSTLGIIVLAIATLAILMKGFRQLAKGWNTDFMRNINTNGIAHDRLRTYARIGQAGYIARGIVLLILGYFLGRAILANNANQVGNTGSAFDFLQNTGGSILLGLVALGVVCYGIFLVVVLAQHRRVAVQG